MSDVFNLIEAHGLELHGDIEHFAELVRQEERGHKTPLNVLNLTVRAEHLLKRGRVHDVETLRAMDARDILAIPELGKKTLKEIMEALLEYEHLAERKRMQEQRTKDQEASKWRGLDEKDLRHLWIEGIPRMSKDRYIAIARQVEAYLKEKNNG
jgi:DNA-directed RNA polymerase, alpha subunit/40 kD subunit